MLEAVIHKLQIQPFKAGGALPLMEARMTRSGLSTVEGDVVDHTLFAGDGKKDPTHGYHPFLTQRVRVNPDLNLHAPGDPRLALIRPVRRDNTLFLTFDGKDEIRVPHVDDVARTRNIPVQVWEYKGYAEELRDHSDWLSTHLGRSVIVARTSGLWDRKARQDYEKNDNPMHAQDGYPVHAVTLEDAEAVFRAIGATTNPNRFRYQVLLEGVPLRDIHRYSHVRIGDTEISQPKPCGRCEVTGISQNSGEMSPIKPLAGLARMGLGRWIQKKGDTEEKVHVMGENWLPHGSTILREGDTVAFTALRNPQPTFEPDKQPR